eukprot:gene7961-1177_t
MYEDAVEDCREVLGRQPENVKAMYRLGRALIGTKQLEQAILELKAAAKVDPRDANVKGALTEARQLLTRHRQRQGQAYAKMFASEADRREVEEEERHRQAKERAEIEEKMFPGVEERRREAKKRAGIQMKMSAAPGWGEVKPTVTGQGEMLPAVPARGGLDQAESSGDEEGGDAVVDGHGGDGYEEGEDWYRDKYEDEEDEGPTTLDPELLRSLEALGDLNIPGW